MLKPTLIDNFRPVEPSPMLPVIHSDYLIKMLTYGKGYNLPVIVNLDGRMHTASLHSKILFDNTVSITVFGWNQFDTLTCEVDLDAVGNNLGGYIFQQTGGLVYVEQVMNSRTYPES